MQQRTSWNPEWLDHSMLDVRAPVRSCRHAGQHVLSGRNVRVEECFHPGADRRDATCQAANALRRRVGVSRLLRSTCLLGIEPGPDIIDRLSRRELQEDEVVRFDTCVLDPNRVPAGAEADCEAKILQSYL